MMEAATWHALAPGYTRCPTSGMHKKAPICPKGKQGANLFMRPDYLMTLLSCSFRNLY